MIARMFGDKKSYAENFNRVPVEKYEVYSCPTRSAEYDGHFLDYVVNSTDSRGPINLSNHTIDPVGGTWYEVEGTTRIDKWKRPSNVAYILEGVEESWNIDNGGRSLNNVRKNIAAIRAQVDPNITMTGFDWFDVPGGYAFPTYKKFLGVPPAARPSRCTWAWAATPSLPTPTSRCSNRRPRVPACSRSSSTI